MTKSKKILISGVILLLIGLIFVYISDKKNKPVTNDIIQPAVPEGPVPGTFKKNSPGENNSPTNTGEKNSSDLPDQAKVTVPFLAQAPFAIWDPLHEDACEEASLLMVKHFLAGDKSISLTEGDVEIRKMIGYEEKNGYGISITMEQLNQIAKNFSGMQTGRIETSITIDDIKKEIAAGRPVIVPAAGKILPNPYFRNGGPLYHMLVVVGYDKNGFITNDPGTKRGEGFRYSFNDLYNAIHDWNDGDVLNGQKTYLVFD